MEMGLLSENGNVELPGLFSARESEVSSSGEPSSSAKSCSSSGSFSKKKYVVPTHKFKSHITPIINLGTP